MEGWIKIYRKMIDWELFKDAESVQLFLACILLANTEDKDWKGISIKRGQFVTSLSKLCEITGQTMRQIRTRLGDNQKCGNLTIKTTNKYSIITICNYDSYQHKRQTNDKQNDKQTTRRATTTKEERINKEIYKERKKENDDVDARAREGFVQIDELENYLLSDEHWLEAVSMKNHFADTSPTKALISEFVLFLRGQGVTEKEQGDARRHFSFWLTKHLQIQQQKNNKENADNNGQGDRSGLQTTPEFKRKRPANDFGTLHKNPNR